LAGIFENLESRQREIRKAAFSAPFGFAAINPFASNFTDWFQRTAKGTNHPLAHNDV
jgi:hypothetical protein